MSTWTGASKAPLRSSVLLKWQRSSPVSSAWMGITSGLEVLLLSGGEYNMCKDQDGGREGITPQKMHTGVGSLDPRVQTEVCTWTS